MALAAGNVVDDADWNSLFTRLRAVASRHHASSANLAKIPSSVVSAGDPTATGNVQSLKTALTNLRSCCTSHISTTFAGKITVPSAGTLLSISNYASVVAEVEAICHNYSDYNDYSAYTDYQYDYGDCWW